MGLWITLGKSGDSLATFPKEVRMLSPLVLLENPSEAALNRWVSSFGYLGDRNKKFAEGLWRRNQTYSNSFSSGWQSIKDARRKVVHYFYEFGIEDGNFVLSNVYLWILYTFPKNELKEFIGRIKNELKHFNWKPFGPMQFKKGVLEISVKKMDAHEKDICAGRIFPSNYASAEITVKTSNFDVYQDCTENPWDVLNSGFRRQDSRSNDVKKITNIEDISSYLPAQIELGCGPSIEAGIAPLKKLHEIYSISNTKTKKFLLNLKKDILLDSIISHPEKFFKKACSIYCQIFGSSPNRVGKKWVHEGRKANNGKGIEGFF